MHYVIHLVLVEPTARSSLNVSESVETLNGDKISTEILSNRAFLYGDGVFTTLKLLEKEPQNIQLHWQRLRSDSRKLGINTPSFEFFNYCLKRTLPLWKTDNGILRISVFREGGRGYRGGKNKDGLLHISIYPLNVFPEVLKLHLVNFRLARNEQLAGIKHLNRLEQIMASAELDDSMHEAVVLDTEGNVISGTMSNIFWYSDDIYYTPELTFSGVNGLTRRKIIQGLQNRNKQLKIGFYKVEELYDATAIWLCNAVRGLLQVSSIDTQEFLLDKDKTSLLETIITE